MEVNRFFREPTDARYIYFNPESNIGHFLLPVVGGTDIGTDNTCSSAKSLKEFFGLQPGQDALSELQQYKAALEHDITMLRRPSEIKKKKQHRLDQINAYIKALQPIVDAPQQFLRNLALEEPKYPEWLEPLIAERSNFFSMLIRPAEMHGAVRAINPVFSLRREDTCRQVGDGFAYDIGSRFLLDMDREYTGLYIANPHPKDLLIRDVVESQRGRGVNFIAIQDTLSERAKARFNLEIDFTFIIKKDSVFAPNGTLISTTTSKIPLTQDYIDLIMGFDEEVTVKEYADTLINNCASYVSSTLAVSPFCVRENKVKETLIVLTQFFLAELNIYCYANRLSTENFGAILDNNPQLSSQVARLVKSTVQDGASVERALFNFINTNYRHFGLRAPLGTPTFNQVQKRFESDYNIIAESEYFDDFTLLFDIPGKFKQHQGAICIDFAEVINSRLWRFDNQHLRASRAEPLPHKIPHNNAFVNEISNAELYTLLINLLTEGQVNQAAALLLATTENGHNVFQRLDRPTIQAIMRSPNWLRVENIIEASTDDADTLEKYYDYFPKQVGVIITDSMAINLYVAAHGALEYPDCINVQSLKKLLENKYQLHHILSVERSPRGLLINFSRPHSAAQLNTHLSSYENKLYCTPAMINTFYQEAVRIYGIDSEQIAQINELKDPSRPLRTILEVLQIDFQEITFPENTQNTIVQVSSPSALTMMLNILRYPTLPADEQMGRFNAAINKLEEHASELENNGHWQSYHAATAMINELKQHGRDYFLNKTINYPRFKHLCSISVESKRNALETRYGWAALLEGFIRVVNSLVYVSSWFSVNNFFKMSPTSSAREVDRFKHGLETAFNEEPSLGR